MLYANNNNVHVHNKFSNIKIKYYSSHLWRLMFLIKSNHVYNTLTKKLYNGSTIIPHMFIGYEIFVYSGIR